MTRLPPALAAAALACIALCIGVRGAPQPRPVRSPVPDAAAQKAAAQLVRDAYKDQIAKAKTREQKAELAKALLQAGADTADDPAGRFALYATARELATAAGDAETAMQAVDRTADAYRVDALAMRTDALTALAKSARRPAEHRAVARRALALVDAAVAGDEYDPAKRLTSLAAAAARKAGDAALVKRIESTGRSLAEVRAAHAKAKDALATLDADPADPQANRAAGEFLCFVKGDWARGLPLLAKADDAALAAQAAADLRAPADAAGLVAVGDGWWTLAERRTGTVRRQVLGRAVRWYREAGPQLSGLAKAKVQQRLRDAAKETAAAAGADALAEVTFEEDMGYTVAALEEGTSSHNNIKNALLRIPDSISGRPFTQQVKDRQGAVKFRFDTPGKVYLLTAAAGVFPPLDAFMTEAAHKEDMVVKTEKGDIQVWSMTGDAGRVVEVPHPAGLVADSLKKGKVRGGTGK